MYYDSFLEPLLIFLLKADGKDKKYCKEHSKIDILSTSYFCVKYDLWLK